MKKIYTLLVVTSLSYFSFGQCAFNLSASDTVACPGDMVTLTASGPISDLLTTLVAGNNHRGNMFSITALNDVVINSFDAHPMGNTTIEIYYKTGTYQGFENNSGAWTFVGSAPVVALPQGTPTPVPIDVNVMIPVGQTYSFYVTSSNVAVSLNYSNGTSVGAVYASDANIQFLEGCGLEYPFTGSPFIPRIWNGVIHYSPVVGPTYMWSNGATTYTTDVSPMSSSYYSVEITANGCAPFMDSVWIDVPSQPVDLGGDVSLCEGESVILDAGILGASYVWNASATDTLQTLTVNTTGTNFVTVTDSIGCVTSDQVLVTVNQNPAVDLGADTVFCVYNTLNLNAGAGFASYLWSNSATTSSITLDGTTLGVGTYTYSVDVMDNNGCMGADTITVMIDGCLAIDELAAFGVNFYPNPTSGIVNVEIPAGQTLQVRIYSADGKLVKEQHLNTSGQVDLAALNAGAYLLELSNNEFSETVRISKQ